MACKPNKGRSVRSDTVSVRFRPETKEAAARVAALTGRTMSGLTEYALVRFIERNFPEAFVPGSRLVLEVDDAPVEARS